MYGDRSKNPLCKADNAEKGKWDFGSFIHLECVYRKVSDGMRQRRSTTYYVSLKLKMSLVTNRSDVILTSYGTSLVCDTPGPGRGKLHKYNFG